MKKPITATPNKPGKKKKELESSTLVPKYHSNDLKTKRDANYSCFQ